MSAERDLYRLCWQITVYVKYDVKERSLLHTK